MPVTRRKAAVIPYRIRNERIEVALVSASNGKRWVVPKGSVDAGEHPRQTAIREADEEAGLRGIVTRRPIGCYLHVNGDGRYEVDVFGMRVTAVRQRWLEDEVRRRRWMTIPDAVECLRKELRPFIRSIGRSAALES
jgi:8-oxo-dGTP pyrophosphatase MutT (NUDIX family)